MTLDESTGSVQLSVGMRVEYQDASWQVTYLDGMQVRIVHTSGKTVCLKLSLVLPAIGLNLLIQTMRQKS